MPRARSLILLASLFGAGASAACTGGGLKPVRLAVMDRSSGSPITMARLRAGPLETNQQKLPVRLAHLSEARAELRVSATTDERGLATLRLYQRKPSLIEITPIDFEDASIDSPPPAWVYDPADQSVTRVTTYGQAIGHGESIELRRR